MALPSTPRGANRLHHLWRRFRRSRTPDEQLARWQAYDEQGAALERLLALPDWTFVEARREVYLRLRDAVLHSPTASDDARARAAMEWNAIEEWFRDLRLCIREGQKAREALAKGHVAEPA